ncbi:hypothetical protein pb186bvf_019686 [Paramecium bursaria]
MKFLQYLLFPIAYILYLRFFITIYEQVVYPQIPTKLITQQGNLIDNSGVLIEQGYSKTFVKQFNPSNLGIFTRNLRLKQWDYLHFQTDQFYLAIAFVNLGYASSLQFTFWKREGEIYHNDLILPLTQLKLSEQPIIQDKLRVEVINKNFNASYDGVRINNKEIRVGRLQFEGLEANFILQTQDQEDIYVLKEYQKGQFFYSRKTLQWETEGLVVFKGETFEFKKALGGMDWGRGVFPYGTFWLWMSAQGYSDYTAYSFNLGGMNQKNATDNQDEVLYINNTIHRLQNLRYNYDINNLERNIYVSNTERVEKDGDIQIEFKSQANKLTRTDLLIVDIKFRQIMGTFKAQYKHNGQFYQFQDIIGIVELNSAKW